MVDKIRQNCPGGSLLSGLDSKLGSSTFALVYNSGAADPSFNIGNSRVTINSLTTEHVLMHELFHGYQAYGETTSTFNAASANLEVEAQLAKFMYMLQKDPSWRASMEDDGLAEMLLNLWDMLDSRGSLMPGVLESEFNEKFREAANMIVSMRPDLYRFDPSRSLSQNLKNLRALTQNC